MRFNDFIFGTARVFRHVCAVRLAALAIASIVWVAPILPTTFLQLDLADLIRQSTAIVRARVKNATTISRNGDVFTLYHLEIAETFKSQKGQTPVELAIPGGVAGGIRQAVPGAPSLRPGAEYVFFLWTGKSGLTQLMGLSQGLFTVNGLGKGETELAQTPVTEQMLDATGHAVHLPAIVMKISDLRKQVAQVLGQSSESRQLATAARESK